MTNLSRITAAVGGVCLLALLSAFPVRAENSISIRCPIEIEVPTQDTVVEIPVYFSADEHWCEFIVGLRYDAEGLDSVGVDLSGTYIPMPFFFRFYQLPDEGLLAVWWTDFTFFPILFPNGNDFLMFTLRLYLPKGIRPQEIDIDSSFVPPVNRFEYALCAGTSLPFGYHDCGRAELIIVGGDCGDVNFDGKIDLADAVYLVAYIFGGGLPPRDVVGGDVDQNGRLNLSDAVFLYAYLFLNGPEPCSMT